MSVIKVIFLSIMLASGCDDEDTAPKSGSNQTNECLDIANEMIDMMTECKTDDLSWQSCSSQIGDKKDIVDKCFAELEEECEEKEDDDLKNACNKKLMEDFGPIEIKMKKIRAQIQLKDCDEKESEELESACREEFEEYLRRIERIEELESKQTEACLEIADEVIDMMTECETANKSWQSCKSTISAKLKDTSECFAYFSMKCKEEANNDLKEACEEQLNDDFEPFETEMKEIKAKIKLNDCDKRETEELKKTCRENVEEHLDSLDEPDDELSDG